MLKNYLNLISVRNFKQSGFFIDFLIKSLFIYLISNLLKTSLLFLEKYIVEYFFKNIKNTISFYNSFKYLNFSFFKIIVFFLNIIILLFLI